MVLSCSYVSLGALEKLPFFKFAADSGIPGECANNLSGGRSPRSMVLEDRVDVSSASGLAKLHKSNPHVLELLLFEKLFYYGCQCSSTKHTTPVTCWVIR
jgi:hypothetical protein